MNNKNISRHPSVGVAIITYWDKKHLKNCLPPLLNSPLKLKVLVFNSTSNDGTVEEAERLGAEVYIMPRKHMNHGLAREECRKRLGTDIVVMMTPDAYCVDEHVIEKLVKPIVEGKASIAYGRQLPHDDAKEYAKFARKFNYPEQSHIRGIEHADKYGSYTNFCSDAFAAWSQKALDEIGGFRWVLAGEDTIATAMLLKKGHKIAYVAEAQVKHSHNYTPKKEFFRHFDTGIYRKRWAKILDMGKGSDQGRGVKFAKEMFAYLKKNKPSAIPAAFLQIACGYAGYHSGRIGYHLVPNEIKKKISHSEFFWKSEEYANGKWKEPAK